ncbi:hypothetical protein C731_0756 [Mycolicibacterium hassiacum DSM 44199]|uniref:Uncharacterized protein n=1 Tax=Mycolicibacterium hassiacum (strain DSM 44199 / CIP 105218 / JCM 12690 / 3849) TaxID=1122247 RepID=K5BKP6_MYCHD|nr:hypothetical protein C731_0756 [Mycolicibacterium hassiacum DSM 44199]
MRLGWAGDPGELRVTGPVNPMVLSSDNAGPRGSGRPPESGGLSVLETLHLVADKAKGHQMF